MKKIILTVLIFLSASFLTAFEFGKKYQNADEPQSIVFYKNHTVFDWTTRGKDSLNTEIEDVQTSYTDFYGIKNLIITTKDGSLEKYLLLYCNIDSTEFVTLLNPTDNKYRNWANSYTYFDSKKNQYISTPVLWRVTVKNLSSFVQEKNKDIVLQYAPKYFGLFSIPWAVYAKEEIKNITFVCETERNDFAPVQDLVIVNGFVCAEKDSLYKENARAKNISISYSDTSFVYELKDTANFQVIHLPKEIQPDKKELIKLEILDFYKGDKYQDIAISGIYFPKFHKN